MLRLGNELGGGFDCELDIVGFHPDKKHLIHIEPSLDTASWAERERKYEKKFKAGKKHIPDIFKGLDIPKEIEQVALFLFGSGTTHKELAGGKVMLVADLLKEIFDDLKTKSIYRSMIDEQKPLLRTLQFVAEYQKIIF